jgi:hypothetical protein
VFFGGNRFFESCWVNTKLGAFNDTFFVFLQVKRLVAVCRFRFQISVKESRLVFLVWLLSRFGFNSDYILLG